MTAGNGHFLHCHPEDSKAPPAPEGYQPSKTENCWHCGTPVKRGCHCPVCLDAADDIPPEVTYHCPVCGRWWAYMTLRIMELIFGKEQQA
jgi:predicted amidophosphoribosyltransferase